jgi:hypothetical protein
MHMLIFIAATVAAIVVGAGVLHLIPRLGLPGRRAADWLIHAPGLDWLITYFTVAPMIVGLAWHGWRGLLAGIAGQIIGLHLWQFAHELANREAMRGPRIRKTLNRKVGAVQNLVAVWLTAIVTPAFWVVRMAELFIYPPITWLVGLPPYKGSEWVNVSRQKFTGLVGHDLIWCLYCDWMTGVWSLGTEMLRNVESFWCPIRFYSEKKCENCTLDFPDIDNGWAPADGTMADVVAVLDEKFPDGEREHPWFGHRVRLTVKGQPLVGAGEK